MKILPYDTNISSWNNFYKKEIQNFKENSEDTGECWFDDSDAESKVIEFLINKLNDGELTDIKSFIDLGTGNGHLLFELYDELEEECELPEEIRESFTFKGVDYSPDSVEFALDIAKEKYPDAPFSFQQVDLLKGENNTFLHEKLEKFDILLDKGTLDAIALNQDPIDEFEGKIGMDVYPIQVAKLMHSNSILLITSCNFTETELVKIITNEGKNEFEVWDKITYPSFKFGGVQGSTICSIAFKLKQ